MNKNSIIASLLVAYAGGNLAALAALRSFPKNEVRSVVESMTAQPTGGDWSPSRSLAASNLVAKTGATSNAYRITKAAFVKASRV